MVGGQGNNIFGFEGSQNNLTRIDCARTAQKTSFVCCSVIAVEHSSTCHCIHFYLLNILVQIADNICRLAVALLTSQLLALTALFKEPLLSDGCCVVARFAAAA
jgi:hypothetical protein